MTAADIRPCEPCCPVPLLAGEAQGRPAHDIINLARLGRRPEPPAPHRAAALSLPCGHIQPQTTAHYAHLDDHALREATNGFGRLMEGAGQGYEAEVVEEDEGRGAEAAVERPLHRRGASARKASATTPANRTHGSGLRGGDPGLARSRRGATATRSSTQGAGGGSSLKLRARRPGGRSSGGPRPRLTLEWRAHPVLRC